MQPTDGDTDRLFKTDDGVGEYFQRQAPDRIVCFIDLLKEQVNRASKTRIIFRCMHRGRHACSGSLMV